MQDKNKHRLKQTTGKVIDFLNSQPKESNQYCFNVVEMLHQLFDPFFDAENLKP